MRPPPISSPLPPPPPFAPVASTSRPQRLPPISSPLSPPPPFAPVASSSRPRRDAKTSPAQQAHGHTDDDDAADHEYNFDLETGLSRGERWSHRTGPSRSSRPTLQYNPLDSLDSPYYDRHQDVQASPEYSSNELPPSPRYERRDSLSSRTRYPAALLPSRRRQRSPSEGTKHTNHGSEPGRGDPQKTSREGDHSQVGLTQRTSRPRPRSHHPAGNDSYGPLSSTTTFGLPYSGHTKSTHRRDSSHSPHTTAPPDRLPPPADHSGPPPSDTHTAPVDRYGQPIDLAELRAKRRIESLLSTLTSTLEPRLGSLIMDCLSHHTSGSLETTLRQTMLTLVEEQSAKFYRDSQVRRYEEGMRQYYIEIKEYHKRNHTTWMLALLEFMGIEIIIVLHSIDSISSHYAAVMSFVLSAIYTLFIWRRAQPKHPRRPCPYDSVLGPVPDWEEDEYDRNGPYYRHVRFAHPLRTVKRAYGLFD